MHSTSLTLSAALAVLMMNGCAAPKQVLAPEKVDTSTSAPLPTAAAPVAAPVAVAPTPSPAPVPLAAIHYELNSSQLSPEAQNQLQALAGALQQRPAASLTISGHTCELGTAEYNLTLGSQRAEQAKVYLVRLGVPAERLHTLSYGEERPAAEGHDDASLSQNRRSEFALDGQ